MGCHLLKTSAHCQERLQGIGGWSVQRLVVLEVPRHVHPRAWQLV